MKRTLLFGLSLWFCSCGAYERAIGVGGLPRPNLKSVHMAMQHDGYTLLDYRTHPDYDCKAGSKNNKN